MSEQSGFSQYKDFGFSQPERHTYGPTSHIRQPTSVTAVTSFGGYTLPPNNDVRPPMGQNAPLAVTTVTQPAVTTSAVTLINPPPGYEPAGSAGSGAQLAANTNVLAPLLPTIHPSATQLATSFDVHRPA